MINIVFTPALILAFVMSLTLSGLYMVRYMKKVDILENSIIRQYYVRNIDGFYIVIGFIYIIIILEHGWRLDPILLFAQYLLFLMGAGMTFDNLRLRKICSQEHDKSVKNQKELQKYYLYEK